MFKVGDRVVCNEEPPSSILWDDFSMEKYIGSSGIIDEMEKDLCQVTYENGARYCYYSEWLTKVKEFKAGDKVRIRENPPVDGNGRHFVTKSHFPWKENIGKVGTIDGSLQMRGEPYHLLTEFSGEAHQDFLELYKEEETKVFKEGDRVRVIKTVLEGLEARQNYPGKHPKGLTFNNTMEKYIGKTGVITSESVHSKNSFKIKDFEDNGQHWVWHTDWLELCEKEKQPEFKAGDMVRIVRNPKLKNDRHPVTGLLFKAHMMKYEGKIETIEVVNSLFNIGIKIKNSLWHPDWLEKVEEKIVEEGNLKRWFVGGVLHRENGPAVISSIHKTKQWYLNGKRHREDGPAIEFADGTKKWYQNGELHREDGPAVELTNGNQQWFRNGKEYSLEQKLKAGDWVNLEIVQSRIISSFGEEPRQIQYISQEHGGVAHFTYKKGLSADFNLKFLKVCDNPKPELALRLLNIGDWVIFHEFPYEKPRQIKAIDGEMARLNLQIGSTTNVPLRLLKKYKEGLSLALAQNIWNKITTTIWG